MCIATKGNLSGTNSWTNDMVKLATGECVACDTYLGGRLDFPRAVAQQIGYPGSRVKGVYASTLTPGKLTTLHKYQTCQFGYWIKQTAGAPTTENTPAGYNTHALTTVNTSEVPIDFGIHWQTTHGGGSDHLYYDLLGLLPARRTIYCSEQQWYATQELEFDFAYLQKSGDAFTKTARAEGTVGTVSKAWDHFSFSFQYNSVAVGCQITGVRINETRTNMFHGFGANGATRGLVLGYDYSVDLEVIPSSNDLFDLNGLDPADYAGDLTLTVTVTADATNDKITNVFNTLYMKPFQRIVDRTQPVEKYVITLVPYNSSSTFSETGIDSLNNDHYENP